MKNLNFLYAAKTVFVLTIISLFAFSCDSTSSTDEHDHEQEPVGLRLKSFENNTIGNTIVEVANGQTTGSIVISPDSSSTFITIFVDEDGEEYVPDREEHSVTFELVTGQTIATTSIPFNAVEPYTFIATGIDVGETTMVVTLLHQGAAEFVTPNIPVSVVIN